MWTLETALLSYSSFQVLLAIAHSISHLQHRKKTLPFLKVKSALSQFGYFYTKLTLNFKAPYLSRSLVLLERLSASSRRGRLRP